MKQDDLHDKRDRDGTGRTVSTGWVSMFVAATFLLMGASAYWLMQRDVIAGYIVAAVATLGLGLLLLEMIRNLRRAQRPVEPPKEPAERPGTASLSPAPFWRNRAFYVRLVGACFLMFLSLDVVFILTEERLPAEDMLVWLLHLMVIALGIVWLVLLLPNRARSRVLIVFRKIKRLRELADVTELLASAIRCNAFLPDMLERAAVDAPNGLTASSLSGIARDLRQGLSLHDALRKRPRFFPAHYTDLVAVGERSGTLETVLKDLAVYLSDDIAFRTTRRNQMAYVIFLVTALATLISFITSWVFPMYEAMVMDFGVLFRAHSGFVSKLFGFTTFTMNNERQIHLSQYQQYYLFLFILLCVFVTFWHVLSRLPFSRRFIVSPRALSSRLFLSVGGFYRRNNLAHIGLLLERLLASGVTLDVALGDVAQASVSRGYARALTRIQAKVEQGTSLADALMRERLFLSSFRSMAAVGESSGMLPSCLGHVARHYRQQSSKRARILLDILLPLCVVIIGLGVMWVEVATLGVISQLSDTLFYSL